jgi:phosphate transport system protein
MDTRFEKELEQLKVKVLQMAAYADRALENTLYSLSNRDADLARQVIDGDREINAMECEVDNLCLRLLALEQPVAHDLRFIVAAMRLVVDLERIGDEAVNTCEQAVLLAQLPQSGYEPEIMNLGGKVLEMLRMAVRSLKDRDPELARQVCVSDSEADEQSMKVLKLCMEATAESLKNGLDRAIRSAMVARSLERIGDLATNVAESAIFVVRGVSIKHHCQPF